MAIALLACGGAFAADAKAGCGDYVQILGAEQVAPAHHDHDQPPAAPCRGPACDRQVPPAVPPVPPAPAAGPQTQLDAVLATADPADPPRAFALAGDPSAVPVPFPSVVFRPPRSL